MCTGFTKYGFEHVSKIAFLPLDQKSRLLKLTDYEPDVAGLDRNLKKFDILGRTEWSEEFQCRYEAVVLY
jgi:hypothetical protein